jgi:heme-degrading monooxygenase HmoA
VIARVWKARTSGPEATQRYRHVFETEVVGHLSALAGFRGAYLLARPQEGWTAIRTLTLFDSLEAVRVFTGDDYGHERVTPQARAALLGSDPVIQHFDVLTEPR